MKQHKRKTSEEKLLESGKARDLLSLNFFQQIRDEAESLVLSSILNTDDIEERERWVQRRKGLEFLYGLIESKLALGKLINGSADEEPQHKGFENVTRSN